ncbi:Retrovirus-related Pol polyprotein from transposon RE2 [Vitis vinifera]|uniref:Retrovirus-related Pol polyprotein from transposon RE2 n=1 Tax=Vitis vinifera TaxID=29760 RepID=A0A438BXF9_VITVI|nr:Retrovirus-related Pol polyprotein from transposon RE2 [Vitis vinifera]
MQCGSQSIAEFSRTFKGLCDQLLAIDRPIDDTDKVHWYVSHSSSNSAYYVQQTSKSVGAKKGKNWPPTSSSSSANSNFLKLKKKQSANIAKAFSACSIQDLNYSKWFPDSGVTSHMTSDTEVVDQPALYSGNERVMVGNGQSLAISHTGSISSLILSSSLLLSNVLVDQVTRTVLGVRRCENGLYVLDRCHHALMSTTSPSPQNGIAERKHRHVTKTGLTLMFHARVQLSLWVEAFSTAVFLINRLPSPLLNGKTPYELLFGKQPDYSMLRTFSDSPHLSSDSPSNLQGPISVEPFSDSAASDSPFPPPVSSASRVTTSSHPMITRGKAAIDYEIQALQTNDTWVLVPCPTNHNVVGCRWIFKTKLQLDGSIEHHKARLGAQGFSQIHGLDFGDTFSPVVRPTTVRIILSLAVTSGWRLHQLDVKNVFLHGFLNEEDLSDLHYFLGIEVQANEKGLFLSQTKYALELLQCASMIDAKPISTPCVIGQHLSTEGKLFSDPTMFRSLAGALQYLTITRPDLSFSVNSICQFMHAPTEDHVLSSTFCAMSKALLIMDFNSINNPLMIFLLTLMQIGQAVLIHVVPLLATLFFFCTNLVSWSSKKQSTVSQSSAEAEYRSLDVATTDIAWIVQLLRDLHVTLSTTPKILCDNQSAIFMVVNPITRPRSKHIAIDYHFVRELVANGTLKVDFIPSHLQLADSLTKGVTKPQFFLFQRKLSVIPSPTLTLQGGDKEESFDSP